MKENSERYVLVTTAHRGVFFGLLADQNGNSISLNSARCAIYWNTRGGFLELAEKGPNDGSRIGSTAPSIQLFDVTSVADVTPEAVKKWRAA